MVVVSLATPPPPRARIAGLTYETTASADRPPATGREVLLSLLLVTAVVALWWYFSG
jgi:hypothetical protein